MCLCVCQSMQLQSCLRTQTLLPPHTLAALGDGSRGHVGDTVTDTGHGSPRPLPTHRSRTCALPLPSAYQVAPALPTFRGGQCAAAPPAQPAAGPGARHAVRALGRCTLKAPAVPTCRAGSPQRNKTSRPPLPAPARRAAPRRAAAQPPLPPAARPSPAQVACGIAEPQLGRLPWPRTEPHGSWRHVNDVLSYFH